MHPLLRPFWCSLLLLALVLTGCDSNEDRRSGSFQAEVRGEMETLLDGSAELFLQTETDGDEPIAFEIVLTAQQSEIVVESVEGSGAPKEATYSVEQTATGATPEVVYVEFFPDRFNSTSERFIGQSGVLTITRTTDDVVEGEFNLDATGTSDPNAEVSIDGHFTASR